MRGKDREDEKNKKKKKTKRKKIFEIMAITGKEKRMSKIIENGIDVSSHNGVIDWQAVKADGVDFAMIRAGRGSGTGSLDPRFYFNMKKANEAGIKCGAYWFSYALTPADAVREAELLLDAVKDYRVDYPLAFDFEYDSIRYAESKGVKVTKQLATEIARAFLLRIEEGGYFASIYADLNIRRNYYDADLTERFDWWCAAWTDREPDGKKGMWQYSVLGSEYDVSVGGAQKVGKINGVPGAVDVNYALKDYTEIIRQKGINHLYDGDDDDENNGNNGEDIPTSVPPTAEDDIKVGDSVRIVDFGGERAVYGGLSSTRGIPVPDYVKNREYTVEGVAEYYEKKEALLGGIFSWVRFDFLKKV